MRRDVDVQLTLDARPVKMNEPSVESILRRKFRALVISYILAGIAVIATALFVGEPYGILLVFVLPVLFFLWPILVFQIVICPYCGQSDPVGLMFANNDTYPAEPRSECPTCRGAMNKPFDPNFRAGAQPR